MDHHRNNTNPILKRMLWCSVVILAGIGIAAAIVRAMSIATAGLAYEHIRQMLPAKFAQDADVFENWFAAYPILTLIHIVPGSIFLSLAPFQFSSRIRTRYTRFHRWSGRVVVLAAFPVGLSGLLLGAMFPYGGLAASSAIFVFSALFLLAVIRAYVAIRRRDVASHREWMIRMFSIGLGIATVRVVGLFLYTITGASPLELLGSSFWLGLGITFAAAELWIRHTRPDRIAVEGIPITVRGA